MPGIVPGENVACQAMRHVVGQLVPQLGNGRVKIGFIGKHAMKVNDFLVRGLNFISSRTINRPTEKTAEGFTGMDAPNHMFTCGVVLRGKRVVVKHSQQVATELRIRRVRLGHGRRGIWLDALRSLRPVFVRGARFRQSQSRWDR